MFIYTSKDSEEWQNTFVIKFDLKHTELNDTVTYLCFWSKGWY